MLLLTHGSPTNDAQRRVFALLHEMGAGAAHRRGVAVLGDGFARFGPVSGVVCTPEAMAVVSAHPVSGGDGYLFAPLQGPWRLGGQTAQIDGLGANPVQQVDQAVKRIVAAVRRGGLDPGHVQSVIAVTGPVSGVAQPETERKQGVVVATAEPEPFADALELATVNRDAGLSGAWTTADVTGVLEALGFDCSSLDVELFTREGFPYSPYVLRPTSLEDTPFSRRETNPAAVRPLRSHGVPQAAATPAAGAVLPSGARVDGGPPTGGGPAALRVVSGSSPAGPAGTTGGPAALLREPDDEPGDSAGGRGSAWRWLVPLAVLLLVGAGIWFGANALLGSDGDPATGEQAAAADDGTGGSTATQSVAGFTFAPGANDSVTACAAHAYGEVQSYLADEPCTGMVRALFLTEVDDQPVAVAVAEVTMPDADGAATLKAMTDTSGTGNVNDLLREGVQPAGYPSADVIVAGEYASSVSGNKVRIVEAAFADGSASTANVDAAADAALQLEL